MRRILALLALLIAPALGSAADAAVLVQAQGLFNAQTPKTAYTAPNQQFQLSFYVNDTLSDPQNATIYDLAYTLNNVAVAAASNSAGFFTTGVTVALDAEGLDQLGFSGADIGSDGKVDYPTFNSYALLFTSTGSALTRVYGSGVISTTFVASIPGVPEPAAWCLMTLGLGVVGAALRRRGPARVAATV